MAAATAAAAGRGLFGWLECCCTRSPIRALLRAVGILLTRISMRVLRPWAWGLYCERSFRARSVTRHVGLLGGPPMGRVGLDTYPQAASCR